MSDLYARKGLASEPIEVRPVPATLGSRSPRGGAWGAVAILTAVAAFNIIDRMLPSLLAQPIKHDLSLSDTTLGLINGFGFLLVYAVMGVPIARLADRGRYGLVISACLALWSVMTALGSQAHSGAQLAFTRVGVALGEAGSIPTAHAFISRNFAPDRRSTPLAVLTLSAPVAGLVGSLGGALLGQAVGWRNTLLIVGLGSLLLAPLVLMVLGPGYASPKETTRRPPAGFASLRTLFAKPSYLLLVAATGVLSIGAYACAAFAPAFLMRVHGMTLRDVGIYFGPAQGLAGVLSLLAVGALADRLSRRDPRSLPWLVTLLLVVLAPFTVAAFIVPDGRMAVALLTIAGISVTIHLAPTVAAVHRLAEPHQRATASAILLMVGSILGGLGPLLTGLISDALASHLGAAALARGLLVVPATLVGAAVLFGLAASRYSKDLATGSSDDGDI